MSGKFTEEELAGLSEEERAAIEDGDDEGTDSLADIAGEDDDDDEFGNHVPDAATDGNADEDGEQGGEDPAGDDTDLAGDEENDRTFVPTMHVEDVGDVKAQLEAIQQQHADLINKYKDGDLTVEELLGEQSKLNNQAVELQVRAAQAEFATRQNVETAQQRWKFAQEVFFEDHPEYDQKKNPVLWGALNEAVKALATDQANAHRSGSWFLKEAHRQVQAMLKGAAGGNDQGGGNQGNEGKQNGSGKQAEGGKKPGKQPSKPDLSAIPQTLGSLPAAAGTETGGGEFDYLDKLTGMEYEMALAKLTPEQQARYLAGG